MLENVSIIARIIAIIQSNNILPSFLGHWNHHPCWHSFEGKIWNFRFYFFSSNICRNSTHWKLPRCLSNCKIFDAVTHYLLKGRKWTYTASESLTCIRKWCKEWKCACRSEEMRQPMASQSRHSSVLSRYHWVPFKSPVYPPLSFSGLYF